MNGLSTALRKSLRETGAGLVGFADMRKVPGCHFPCGVAVAVPVPVHIVHEIEDGPTLAYYEMYHELNARLNRIVTAGAEFLEQQGFRAHAQTTGMVKQSVDHRSELPHKTVAARAGLGWIGKSCLLVTPEYGSALRLSSLLTDAPLDCAAPVSESRCGGCGQCVKACPAQALNGVLWCVEMDRDQIFRAEVCRKKQSELMKQRTGIETDLCGKCFVVCPYTRRYLNRADNP